MAVDIRWEGDILDRPEARKQREQVLTEWALPVGQDFSQSQWSQAKTRALRLVQAERYPQARITDSQADVDAQTNQVRLSITLDSGPQVHLGPLVITGTERYSAEILRTPMLIEAPNQRAYYRQLFRNLVYTTLLN